MPLYLKSINFSIVAIGVLEGFAEALAGLSKGYFGKLSDTKGKRVPFIKWGYFLSSVSKPMMAVFIWPVWIFLSRSIDRLGKGIRTGARDAMLSDEATEATKGRVFGLHRSMDTLGAAIGPIIALIYLYYNPGQYKTLFLIAFIPGIFTIILTNLIKDRPQIAKHTKSKTTLFSFTSYWHQAPPLYRKVVIGLLFFTLFNSSDVFLLLQLKQSGIDDNYTIILYIFYNIVYAGFAYPIGILADKIGLKTILIIGFIIFSLVYAGMSINTNMYVYVLLFFMYGLYAAATEGIAKAWITNIAEKHDKATAIGTFTSFQSVCTMLASSLTGVIWYKYGSSIALTTTAIATILCVVYFFMLPTTKRIS
jgi:MFS family permease